MSDIVEQVRRTPLRRRQMWSLVLLGGIIFTSGFIAGAGASFLWFKDRMRPQFPGSREGFVQSMVAKYGLTDDQAKQVERIFKARDEEMRTLWSDSGKKMDALRTRLIEDMRGVLTPEQFKPWQKDFLERFDRHRGKDRPFRDQPGKDRPQGGPPPRDRQGKGQATGDPPQHRPDVP